MNSRLPIAAFGGFAMACAVPALAQTTPADPGAMQSAPASDPSAAAPAPDASATAPADPSAAGMPAASSADPAADTTTKKKHKKHKKQASDSTGTTQAPQ
jgi:hypothetical protein